MAKFRSGRLSHLHIGISSFTDNKLVLDVIGNTNISGAIGVGGSFGGLGQYLKSTGTGAVWQEFPAVRTRTSITAIAGQNAFFFNHNAAFLDVYVNGIKLNDDEYASAGGTQVNLVSPCFAGDQVEIVSFNSIAQGGGGSGGGNVIGLNTSGTSTFTNISVAGVVTATNFYGNLTGNVTGNVVGDITGTSRGLAGTPDITVRNIVGAACTLGGNLKVGTGVTVYHNTGIISATRYFGDGSGLTGVASTDVRINFEEEGNNIGIAGTVNFVGTGVTATWSNGTTTVEIGDHYARIAGIATVAVGLKSDSTIDTTGIISATTFYGSGAGLTNLALDVQANNFNDETCYPLFVDGVTGSRIPETDNDLRYNPASSALTASVVNANTFVGSLNGNAQTASNAFGLTGTPTIYCNMVQANGFYSSTGIVTATTFVGNLVGNVSNADNINAVNGSFSGNVSIGGTLTYEDVTNIDSVGVITARDGIRVGSGKSIGSDGSVTYYGDGGGLTNLNRPQIYLGDAAPTVPSTGELWWKSDEGMLKVYYQDTDSSQWVDAAPTGGSAVEILNDATPQLGGQLELNNYNIIGTGNINIDGSATVTSLNVTPSGGSPTNSVFSGTIEASSGENKIPSLYSTQASLPDPSSYDGMFAHVNQTGRGYFSHASGWHQLVNVETNGNVGTGTETYNIGGITATGLDLNGDLDVDGHTNLDNVNVAGVTTFSGLTDYIADLTVTDDKKIRFGGAGSGSPSDFSIYHDTADGNTRFTNEVSGVGDVVFDNSAGTVIAKFIKAPQSVELYYAGTKRLATVPGGVKVSGTVGAAQTALVVDGDLRVTGVGSFGAGSVSIATSAISYTGYGATIGISTLLPVSGSTIVEDVLEVGASNIHLNSKTWISGHVLPNTDSVYDLGSVERKLRHLFLSDNSLWLGDLNRMDTSAGDMKIKKRKTSIVPKSITDLSGDVSGAISHANTTFGYSPAKTQSNQLTLQDLLSYLISLDNTKDEITDLYPAEFINGSSNSDYTANDWEKINADATIGFQSPFVTKGFSSPP